MNKKINSEYLFVPREIAVELKNKGFNDFEVFAHSESNGLVYELWVGKDRDYLSIPLITQVIDWLEKEYKIEFSFSVGYSEEDKLWRSFNILILEGGPLASDVLFFEDRNYFETKNEIILKAIEKAITLI